MARAHLPPQHLHSDGSCLASLTNVGKMAQHHPQAFPCLSSQVPSWDPEAQSSRPSQLLSQSSLFQVILTSTAEKDNKNSRKQTQRMLAIILSNLHLATHFILLTPRRWMLLLSLLCRGENKTEKDQASFLGPRVCKRQRWDLKPSSLAPMPTGVTAILHCLLQAPSSETLKCTQPAGGPQEAGVSLCFLRPGQLNARLAQGAQVLSFWEFPRTYVPTMEELAS